MSSVISTVQFEFVTRQDLPSAVDALFVTGLPLADPTSVHLGPLADLADELKVPTQALELAKRLARGMPDFLVVLLEPTDIYSKFNCDEVIKKCPTLKMVDQALRGASNNQRNIDNTCVLDIRPFRSASVRLAEKDVAQRELDDDVAYRCFQDMLHLLKPSVILVAQCSTRGSALSAISSLASDFSQGGVLESWTYAGRDMIKVNSFHPSTFLRDDYVTSWLQKNTNRCYHRLRSEDAKERKALLEELFRLSFMVAMNALIGRKIVGYGPEDLRRAVKWNGPAEVMSPAGHMVTTYQVVAKDDPAVADFVALMQGLAINDHSSILDGLLRQRASLHQLASPRERRSPSKGEQAIPSQEGKSK